LNRHLSSSLFVLDGGRCRRRTKMTTTRQGVLIRHPLVRQTRRDWQTLDATGRLARCDCQPPIPMFHVGASFKFNLLQQTLIAVESDQSNAIRSTPCAVTRALSASPTSSHHVTRVRAASSSNQHHVILRDRLPSSLE
jgi:hypothetical protein